jgi:hypothetical protein
LALTLTCAQDSQRDCAGTQMNKLSAIHHLLPFPSEEPLPAVEPCEDVEPIATLAVSAGSIFTQLVLISAAIPAAPYR